MNEADFSSANVLSRLFSSISVDKLKESSEVMTAWQQTLHSIKGFQSDGSKPADYGSQLADHSRIVDLKDGILIVETDHPGRIQMFQLYKRYILSGLKKRVPGIPVTNIVFKLRKVETVSCGLRMPTREEIDKAAGFESAPRAADAASSSGITKSFLRDEDGSSSPASNKNGAALAPELQDIFADMKAALNDQK